MLHFTFESQPCSDLLSCSYLPLAMSSQSGHLYEAV
jgi:hypothetical protein